MKCERITVAPRVTDGGDPFRNTLSGTLRDVIFKGQTADYLVALTNGTELIASGASQLPDLKRGDTVSAVWRFDAGQSFAGGMS